MQDKLIIDFALVMVLLLVVPLISARLRLPEIVGLILAGVIVGDYGLKLLTLDATFMLLSGIGLLYLMFLAGLEINLNEFHRYRRPGLIFGAITFLVPQIVGTFGARWLFHFDWPASVLLATMFASHTLISFPIVQRFGVAKNRGVTTAIGGTILTDTAALLVLAIIVQRYSTTDLAGGKSFWVQMAFMLTALLVAAIYILPRIGYWFFRRTTPDGIAEYVFVLAMMFVMAYVGHLAKVHFIIGAFLAGLALSPLLPERGVLTNRVHFVGNALFIPFFLLAVGMQVNLRELTGGIDSWLIAGFMAVAVTILKFVSAYVTGELLGYTREETGVLFGLSVNQAAATLAAALVGVEAGIFGNAVLNGAILMILITCLIGPWVTERCARRLAELEAKVPREMNYVTGRVLVPISAPKNTDAVIDLALMIRSDRTSEPIYPISVVLDGPDVNERLASAERILGTAVGRALAANAPVIPLARIDTNVVGGILHAAMEFRVSTIVLCCQMPQKHIQFFQGLPDLITSQSGQMILIYRPGIPINTTKRMWFVMPPLIEKHPGIHAAIATARRVASQAGAKIRIAATPSTIESVKRLKLKPQITDADFEMIHSWGEAGENIRKYYQPGDSIILLSSRRERLAWQPSLERLPVEWANAWPDSNIIIMYAPLAELEKAEEAFKAESIEGCEVEGEPQFAAMPALKYIVSQNVGNALREILSEIVEAEPGELEQLSKDVEATGPVPLSPTIILMHAHTPLIDKTKIIVGMNDAGFNFRGYKTIPTRLVILLSPAEGGEEHLHALAAIAKGVRDGSLLRGEEIKSS